MNATWLIPLISIPMLLILARILLFLVQVEGWSMYPTYHHEDRLLAIRLWPHHWLRRGQIVVLNLPSKPDRSFNPNPGRSKMCIKRIIGLPGDKVIAPVMQLPDPLEGEILIDEAKQELKSWYIPEEHCFIKGDSPGFDSTTFGPLPLYCIHGVILARLKRVHDTLQAYTLTDVPEQTRKADEL